MEQPEKKLRTLSDMIADFGEKVDRVDPGLWEHEPVNVETFINDPMYLDFAYNPVTKTGCRPCVMKDLKAIFGDDPYRITPIVNEAYFSEAFGTGKTTKIGIACAFMAQKLLCLSNPLKTLQEMGCQIGDNAQIVIMVLARTEQNAKDNAFSKVNSFISQCKWFQDHYMPAPEVTRKIELDAPPRNRYKFDSTKVYKNVHIVPGSSSEYSALSHDTILGVIDEVTKFAAAQDRMSYDEDADQAEILFAAVKGRIDSRYGNNGLVMCFGNPEHKHDFLERHMEKQAGKANTYIVKRRSQWASQMPDFNPDTDSCFYFDVSKQRIVPDRLKGKSGIIPVPYGEDDMYYEKAKLYPEQFTRNYAGYPTAAVGQYASDIELIANNANKDRQSPLKPGSQPDLPEQWVEDWFEKKHHAWHSLFLDLGETGDPAAFCLSHPYKFDANGNPFIYVDMIYRFEGSPSAPFQIRWMYSWIDFFVSLGIPIGIVGADTHGSVELLQTLDSKGFVTENLSLDKDRKPHDNLVQIVADGRLDYYPHDVFDREYRGLEKQGDKIVKPRHGTDDVWWAVGGSVWYSMKLARIDPPEEDDLPGTEEEFKSEAESW